jgi:hypothetical protein
MKTQNLNKPKSCVVEARCDLNALATIAKFYVEKEGLAPKSKSALVNEIINDFSHIITTHLEAYSFKSTLESNNYLKSVGLSFDEGSRSGDRNKKSFIKQIQKETLEASGFDPSYATGSKASLIDDAIKMFNKGDTDVPLPTGQNCKECKTALFKFSDGTVRCMACPS